jgi:LPS export ABC transporter permease LptF/LPS export ABC transporter permease LptG
MRILDRYIFREVLSHALLGLAVFTFVFFIPQLVRLMDLVVRHSGGAGRLALLFLSSLPPVLAFTLPMASLVGVLIGLGRLSADSEIVALHALGIGMRRLLLPVGILALASSAITLAMTMWLGPASVRTLRSLEEQLRSSQVPYAVQPRVFDERFPHLVIYVQDVEAAATRWRGVLLAETDSAAGSRLTLAEGAIVVAGAKQGKFELHLGGGSTHEYNSRDPLRYNVSTFGSSDLPIDVIPSAEQNATLSDAERSVRDLLKARGPSWRESRVELHRRLAFPTACLVFALLGVSAGVRPRRGGRAAGLVLTLLLICGYYLLFVAGLHLAQQGAIGPGAGVWGANVIAAIVALILLRQIEEVRSQGWFSRWWDALALLWKKPIISAPAAIRPVNGTVSNGPITIAREPAGVRSAGSDVRATAFPLLVDLYLLRTFFAYFLLVLGGFVALFDAFTLFDLLGDISRRQIPGLVVINYFRYLVPYLVYQLTPLAALVATLVTLGILAKNNEVVAFKASGVSLYRLSFPLLLAGALLAGGMFLLDDTFLPYANQRQDALRNRIKGRPAQTYFQPAHQWIFGQGTKLYNYALFDPDRNLFGGLNVFELDPVTFQMRRRVFADRAQWEPEVNAWVLEKGWVRDFDGARVVQYVPFRVYSLVEMAETPGYFKREVRQYYQMNWRQLRAYIQGLRQAGFDTSRLSVQWHKKFAFPLIAAIIVFLSAPFAFLVGTRGAIGGLALAVGIGIVYWATAALFEAMGAVGQLPPLLASWTPDAVFLFLGAYCFLKMPT